MKLTCDNCLKVNSFTKQIIATKPPHILIIHFKRFEYSNGGMHKLTHMVDYPIRNLNMSKYTYKKKKTIYDLFAVCCHHGNLDFGHYYSQAYNNVESKWVLFNDYKTSIIKREEVEETIKSSDAYLLFYIKRDLACFKRQTINQYE